PTVAKVRLGVRCTGRLLMRMATLAWAIAPPLRTRRLDCGCVTFNIWCGRPGRCRLDRLTRSQREHDDVQPGEADGGQGEYGEEGGLRETGLAGEPAEELRQYEPAQ